MRIRKSNYQTEGKRTEKRYLEHINKAAVEEGLSSERCIGQGKIIYKYWGRAFLNALASIWSFGGGCRCQGGIKFLRSGRGDKLSSYRSMNDPPKKLRNATVKITKYPFINHCD